MSRDGFPIDREFVPSNTATSRVPSCLCWQLRPIMYDEDAPTRSIHHIGCRRAKHTIPPAVPVTTDHDEIRVQTITSCEYASPRLPRIAHGRLFDDDVRVTSGYGLQLPSCLFHQDCRKLVRRHACRRRKLLWNRDRTVEVNPTIAPPCEFSGRAQNAGRALGSVLSNYRNICGHATVAMQEHESTIAREEVRPALSNIISLAGYAGMLEGRNAQGAASGAAQPSRPPATHEDDNKTLTQPLDGEEVSA